MIEALNDWLWAAVKFDRRQMQKLLSPHWIRWNEISFQQWNWCDSITSTWYMGLCIHCDYYYTFMWAPLKNQRKWASAEKKIQFPAKHTRYFSILIISVCGVVIGATLWSSFVATFFTTGQPRLYTDKSLWGFVWFVAVLLSSDAL